MAPMRAVSVPCSWSAAERACSGVAASIRSATASACSRSRLPLRNARSVNSPGSRQPRAGAHRGPDDAFQQQRVSVSADLGHVLAGVGVWRLEADDHRVVVRLAPGRIEDLHLRERGHAGWSAAGGDPIGNPMRLLARSDERRRWRRAPAASPRRRSCRPERTRHLGFARTKRRQLNPDSREAEPTGSFKPRPRASTCAR